MSIVSRQTGLDNNEPSTAVVNSEQSGWLVDPDSEEFRSLVGEPLPGENQPEDSGETTGGLSQYRLPSIARNLETLLHENKVTNSVAQKNVSLLPVTSETGNLYCDNPVIEEPGQETENDDSTAKRKRKTRLRKVEQIEEQPGPVITGEPVLTDTEVLFQLRLFAHQRKPSCEGQCLHELRRLSRDVKGFLPEAKQSHTGLLRWVVAKWFDVASKAKSTGTTELDEFVREFFTIWRETTVPAGEIEGAIKFAVGRMSSVILPGEFHGMCDTRQNLLRLCVALQQWHRTRPFYLAIRTPETLGMVGRETARKRLKEFCERGTLELITRGTRKTGNASEYRVDPELMKRVTINTNVQSLAPGPE